MSYKVGLILSMIFVAMFFLFGADLITVQSVYSMLDAKAKFEAELKKSGLTWVIFRPSGYFYDIAKVFMPMIEKGKVTLSL